MHVCVYRSAVLLLETSSEVEEENLSDFIPKLVELRIMRTMLIVAKLMKHGIKNLIKWEEIPIPVGPPKSQLHLNATPYIQP